MTAIRAVAESHVGYVRSNNEDLAVVSSDLVAIADGVGGHLGGEVAARTAIEELIEGFQRDRTAAGLSAAVQKANRAIWRRSRVDRRLHGMGTTLTAAALVHGPEDEPGAPSHLALVNIGDSRAYRLDESVPDNSPVLTRLTEDHSVVEEMVRQGELTPAEALVHPHRHILTRVLGMEPEVEIDVWDLELQVGTRFLLCSDGLSNEVTEEDIAGVLADVDEAREAARALVNRALAHGGVDNVTVAIVDVVDAESPDGAQPMELVPPRPPMPDRGDGRTGEVNRDGDVTGTLLAARPETETEPGERADEPGGGTSESLGDWLIDTGPPTMASVEARPAASPRHLARSNGRTITVRGAAAPESSEGSDVYVGTHTEAGRRATLLVSTRALSKQYRDRIVTGRVVVYLLVLACLLGGLVTTVAWFQRSSFFVGLDGARVSIYQGRPGGILWFAPQLLETSSLTTRELLPNSVSEVRGGIDESSYAAARQELSDLTRLASELGLHAGAAKSTSRTAPTARTARTAETPGEASATTTPGSPSSAPASPGTSAP